MSINLVNSADGWFNRAGAIAGETNRVAALYGSSTDTGFQSIWTLYATSEQAAVVNLPAAVPAFRLTDATYLGVLANAASQSSILQVNRDSPLTPYTFAGSFARVRAQMVSTSQSIQRATLGSTVTVGGSNDGNTKVFVSTTNVYGDPLDSTFAETMTVTCTSQGSGFASSFSVVGQPLVATTAYNWPGGSGTSATLTAVDPAVDGIVTNSSLDTFTVANTPDDWSIINGSAGSTVFKSASGGVRTGTNAVYLQSDGSSATKLAQAVTLTANTVYAVTFQVKMNSNSASGTLVIQLYDTATAAVITNDAGTSLQASYNLNGGAGEVTTSYQLLTVFFSTPRQIPASLQLRIGYGTAGVSTRQLTFCNVQVYAATPLYGASGTGTSGPFAIAVANTTYSAINDSYTIAFTNSLTAQSFVWGLERVYALRGQGLYAPSSLSPTISEGLVTH